ncbi:MAG: NfeD family protein [Thermoplasmataceae archaeon]
MTLGKDSARKMTRREGFNGAFLAIAIDFILIAFNLIGIIGSVVLVLLFIALSATFGILFAMRRSYHMLIPSLGSLTIGIILYVDSSLNPGGEIFPKLLSFWSILFLVISILSSILIGVIITVALSATLERRYTGSEALIGKIALTRSTLDPSGWVSVEGIQWRALSQVGPIPAGKDVRVVALKGLTLIVEPIMADAVSQQA